METITIPLSEYQHLLNEIKALKEQVNKLTARVDDLLAENKALKNNVAKLTQQLHGKKKDQIKGKKSKRFYSDIDLQRVIRTTLQDTSQR